MADPNRTIILSPPLLAVGLARCSTARQDKSIAQQTEEIRAWAEASSHRLLDVFEDEGISGSELSRPGLDRLLKFVEGHAEKGVVCIWKRNRLARPDDPLDGLLLERRIKKAGWSIHFLQGTKSSGDPFLDGLVGYVEHHMGGQYLRDLSADTIRGLVQRILDGEVPGGKVPYGYAKVLVDPDGSERVVARRTKHRKLKEQRTRWVPGDPDEIKTICRIFERYASGAVGMADLAAQLNEDTIPSPGGGRWGSGTLRDILRNPVYVGELLWNRETSAKLCRISGGKAVKHSAHASTRVGEPGQKERTQYAANDQADWIVLKDHHPALVERSVWEEAQEVSRSRARGRGRRTAPRLVYPLSGLVHCAQCGAAMNGTSVGRADGYRYRKYICASHARSRACEPYTVDAAKLDRLMHAKLAEVYLPSMPREQFRRNVLKVLQRRVGQKSTLPDAASLERRRAKLARKIDTAIANMGEVSALVAQQLGLQVEEWSAERGRVEERLAEVAARRGRVGDLEQAADDVVNLVYGLADLADEATGAEKQGLFKRVVERVELHFETEPPKPGKTRKRHRLVGGFLVAASLLLVAQQAVTSGACSPPEELESAGKHLRSLSLGTHDL